MDAEQIATVRSFNRTVTQRVGALDDSYITRGRPLAEARVLYEIGVGGGIALSALRRRLALDSGYLSRLLRSLERQQLVAMRKSRSDGRARQIVLTDAGEEEFSIYNALSDELAQSMLSPLDPARQKRLVAAMAEVERLIRAASLEIAVEAPDSADARHCLESYYAELARRFDGGFDPDGGNVFTEAEMRPPAGWLLVARLDGAAIGCGALKRLDAAAGEIKRVWISPDARGLGLASRLMDRLEAVAREAGFGRVKLDTNKSLSEAQALYRKRGYHEIARYNDNPYAHHWFEKRL